jgi:hypothetical protein
MPAIKPIRRDVVELPVRDRVGDEADGEAARVWTRIGFIGGIDLCLSWVWLTSQPIVARPDLGPGVNPLWRDFQGKADTQFEQELNGC